MFKKSMVLLMVICALGIMAYGVIGSGAWFSDQATSNPSTIYSGTLSINDSKLSTATLTTIDNMVPGDKTGDVVIVIENNGNVPLIWFGNLVVEGNSLLKEAIYIDYALMEFEGGSWQEADDNFITNGVGSGPYPSWYNYLATLSPFGVITLNNFDGNNGMGTAPDEFVGALNPGYAYRLTLRFGFAEGAGNPYQHLGPLNISFSAYATQPKEAPIQAHNPLLADNYWPNWALGQLNNQTP